MESRVHTLEQADSRPLTRRRWWTGLARTALGLALLAALVFWGQIDLRALLELSATPSAIGTCFGLLLTTMVVAAGTCLAVFTLIVLLRPMFSILATTLGIGFPIVLLLFLRWTRRKGATVATMA